MLSVRGEPVVDMLPVPSAGTGPEGTAPTTAPTTSPAPAATRLRLVGLEELSATAVRDRLLARRAEFWSGTPLTDDAVLGLHDPLFFHQLGGFGAVALTEAGDDVGYLLGVVSADRLAVVHALAVHPEWRGQGIAIGLITRFAGLATGVGARAVQAVAVPGDRAVRALADRFGAHAAPSQGHAGTGQDRVVFTRALPLG